MKKLLIKTGTYEKEGQTKNRYTQLGVILSNDNGEYALIDPSVNLAGCLIQQNAIDTERQSTRLMVSVFEEDNQKKQYQPNPARQDAKPSEEQVKADFNDNIPF